MSIFHTIKKGLLNLPGWTTKRKIVVIESDDWGTISIPSKDVRDKLFERNLFPSPSAFRKYDCLESEDDLNEVFGLLSSYTDFKGNHPCITACTIVANPDFEKIENS